MSAIGWAVLGRFVDAEVWLRLALAAPEGGGSAGHPFLGIGSLVTGTHPLAATALLAGAALVAVLLVRAVARAAGAAAVAVGRPGEIVRATPNAVGAPRPRTSPLRRSGNGARAPGETSAVSIRPGSGGTARS